MTMKQLLHLVVASLMIVLAAGAGVASATPISPQTAIQAAGQAAQSSQSASSTATSTQDHPSNTNISVRVLSPGNGGDVSQSNSSTAESIAANLNKTAQSTAQQQSGGGGASSQDAGQASSSTQSADSAATSTQDHASNTNIPVRVLSPGNDGDVSQSNSSTAGSLAVNANGTGQSIEQSQGGGASGPAPAMQAIGQSQGGPAVQAAGQKNGNWQEAESSATSTQDHPSNTNIPVRVLSPGNDGSVDQSNDSTALSLAANLNHTSQDADQHQGGGGGYGAAVQAAGQEASSKQEAESAASSTQSYASNTNIPVRVLSPGNDGDVTQSNSSTALSAALNANLLGQSIDQQQGGGGGTAVQAAGQSAANWQDAESEATSTQHAPSNLNAPVSTLSPGNGGSVSQSNSSTAASAALNINALCQSIRQHQGGAMVPCMLTCMRDR